MIHCKGAWSASQPSVNSNGRPQWASSSKVYYPVAASKFLEATHYAGKMHSIIWFHIYIYDYPNQTFIWPLTPSDLARFGVWELSPSVFCTIESLLDLGHFEPPLLQNLSGLTFNQYFSKVSLCDLCTFLGPQLKTHRLTISISLDGLRTLLQLSKPDVSLSSIYTYQAMPLNRWTDWCQTWSAACLLSKQYCARTSLVIHRPSDIFLICPSCGILLCTFPKGLHKKIY